MKNARRLRKAAEDAGIVLLLSLMPFMAGVVIGMANCGCWWW